MSVQMNQRQVQKCCKICFLLLLVPFAEAAFVFVFRFWPGVWFGTVPWIVSVVIGLLFGLQACSLADRTADGAALAAFLLHIVSLLTLIMGSILAVSAD
jgi:hypothetical protein